MEWKVGDKVSLNISKISTDIEQYQLDWFKLHKDDVFEIVNVDDGNYPILLNLEEHVEGDCDWGWYYDFHFKEDEIMPYNRNRRIG